MYTEPQIRALDVCIQKMQAGDKVEGVLELYPQWAEELTPALEAVQVLVVYCAALAHPPASLENDRVDFLRAAQHLAPRPARSAVQAGWFKRLAWLSAILFLMAAGVWIYTLSSLALPGDRLYPLKESLRQVRVWITDDPQQRLSIEQAYDIARLEEIQTLAAMQRDAVVRFSGPLEADTTGAWNIGNFPLQIPPQAQMIGRVQEGAWVSVSGELLRNGSVLVAQIRPREYVLQGTLQSVSPDQLIISGIPVSIDSSTLVHGSPLPGELVEVIASRGVDDRLMARLVDTKDQ